MIDSSNRDGSGVHMLEASAEVPVTGPMPRFNDRQLRKLARLHATAMGVQEVAQAAQQIAQGANARFQEGLAEACEEIGVALPQGNVQAQIDWRTGDFLLLPEQVG
jgi:hypothetical protein